MINCISTQTEGKDDMPAHIKSALTNNQISLSLKNGRIITWNLAGDLSI